jgi:hypothetical protein
MTLRVFVSLLLVLGCCPRIVNAVVIDFEELTVPNNGFYRGDPGTNGVGSYDGTFISQDATFNNTFSIQLFGSFLYKSWGGWGYSNTTDVTSPGVDGGGNVVNESSAYNLPTGGGAGGSDNYGVAFGADVGSSVITLPFNMRPLSMEVTNTTYSALSMLQGDSFTFPFAAGDWFLLQVIGWDATNQAVAAPIDFYLADYRDGSSTVIDEWTTIDLASLSEAKKLTFALSSNVQSEFGMVTPAFFAMDNLVLQAVPEPVASTLLLIGMAGLLRFSRQRGRHSS